MAGIICNSASKTMLAGATSADNAVAGRVTGEQCTLTVSPTGTDYEWSIAIPSSSSAARSALSATTGSSVTFTPDVPGVFTLVAVVDSTTTYVLRVGVTSTAISQLAEAIRQTPKAGATVPAPAVGLMSFFSDDFSQLAVKDPSDRVWPVLTGAMGAALTDADQTLTVAGGTRYVLPESTLTDTRAKTVSDSGAVRGNVIELVRYDTSAEVCTVAYGGTGSPVTWAANELLRFKHDGSTFQLDERRALS
jgi:hypothetical protein